MTSIPFELVPIQANLSTISIQWADLWILVTCSIFFVFHFVSLVHVEVTGPSNETWLYMYAINYFYKQLHVLLMIGSYLVRTVHSTFNLLQHTYYKLEHYHWRAMIYLFRISICYNYELLQASVNIKHLSKYCPWSALKQKYEMWIYISTIRLYL